MEPTMENRSQSEEDNGSETSKGGNMMYTLKQNPPLPVCLMLGFQHFLMAFVCTPTIPLLLVQPMCMTGDKMAVTELLGVNFVVAGVATLLQLQFGVRLPIIQGSSATYLAPIFAILSLPQWKCHDMVTSITNATTNETSYAIFYAQGGMNMSGGESTWIEAGSQAHKQVWSTRMGEVSGAIMVASLLQVALGCTGLLSWLLRFVGPLSTAPTIALIGLGLMDVAAEKASGQWWIAILTLVLIVAFSERLYKVTIPIPCCFRQSNSSFRGNSIQPKQQTCGRSIYRLPVFAMFPVLLGMVFTWLLCFLLTVTDVFPRDPDQWGYSARTDINIDALYDANWFNVPYPGWLGVPTVSVGAVLGVMAGILASVVESVGDYYACAQLADTPPPPPHAINRGIAIEGISSIIGGALGAANGSTSYSQNIAAISITKVASRSVTMVAGVMLLAVGFVGKAGALFVVVPEPILGGLFILLFGTISAVGLSQLSNVDISKSRTQVVIGTSLILGLGVPRWMVAHLGSVRTGSDIVDQMLEVLLSNGMLVGGFTGCLLDNVLPGTREERGMVPFKQRIQNKSVMAEDEEEQDVYGHLPLFHTLLQRFPVLRHLPFCPPTHSPVPSSPYMNGEDV